MCVEVSVNGAWCDTVGDLRIALCGDVVADEHYSEPLCDAWCLCCVDLPATLTRAGLEWTKAECGDYHAKRKG